MAGDESEPVAAEHRPRPFDRPAGLVPRGAVDEEHRQPHLHAEQVGPTGASLVLAGDFGGVDPHDVPLRTLRAPVVLVPASARTVVLPDVVGERALQRS